MLSRRTLLAGAAVGATASAATAAGWLRPRRQLELIRMPGGAGTDYRPALDAIAAYAEEELAAWSLPGMTLGLVDISGFKAIMTFGHADIDRRAPVTPAHLFQIGSISKSFAAICLLGFVDEGKLDLDAPMSRYLATALLPNEPITVKQVLSHSAGLPDDAPLLPRVPEGRLWTGFAPGSAFSYSNTGYTLLGLLIARLGGAPHPEVIRRRVLQPLGMTASLPAIFDDGRPAYATGYIPLIGSRPFLPGDPLVTGGWYDEESAAGSIASTPDDMNRYLAFLLGAASGKGTPLLSDASAKALTTPLIDAPIFGAKARYGAGLATVLVNGHPCLHHTGGMSSFSSSFHVDAEAGVGCFASVNAQLGNMYRPRLVTAYATEVMRHARRGAAVPKPPEPLKALRVDRPERYVGRFLATDGTTLDITQVGAALRLASAGKSGRLMPSGSDTTLVTDHPAYAAHRLSAEVASGRIVGYWWRDQLFGRNAPEDRPGRQTQIGMLAGAFADPTGSGATYLFARGDKLVTDGGDVWTERPGGFWSAADDKGGVERFRFDALVDDRPYRLNASGWDQLRRETV